MGPVCSSKAKPCSPKPKALHKIEKRFSMLKASVPWAAPGRMRLLTRTRERGNWYACDHDAIYFHQCGCGCRAVRMYMAVTGEKKGLGRVSADTTQLRMRRHSRVEGVGTQSGHTHMQPRKAL